MAGNPESLSMLGKAICWLTLISGILTVLVWCFLLPSVNASLSVQDGDFLADVNKGSFRFAMFSFVPAVFIDIWTPFIMGFISILTQFKNFRVDWLNKSYARLFLWNFTVALFANLGYSGGIGIIVGSVTLCVTLLCLVMAILQDGECCLGLELNMNLIRRK